MCTFTKAYVFQKSSIIRDLSQKEMPSKFGIFKILAFVDPVHVWSKFKNSGDKKQK